MLEVPANAIGPAGQRGVELIGIDPRFALKGSGSFSAFDYAQVAHLWALAVPSPDRGGDRGAVPPAESSSRSLAGT